jgi:TRAP-type C4-dicarboxylate transport system substrate-binding protein
MKNHPKTLMVICMVITAIGLFASPVIAAKQIEFNVAIHTDPKHPMFLIGERFKKNIEASMGDRIKVRLLGLKVGGERDHPEGVSSGEYQVALGGSVPLTLYAPKFAAPDLPFVYPSSAAARKRYTGNIGKLMNQSLIQKGNMRLIGLSMRNPRNLTAKRPVRFPQDIIGSKMRVPQIAAWVKIWASIGAMTSPIAWPEVYTALQTGVIEMQENPVDVIWNSRIYEVQDHIMLTRHVFSFFHWLVSEEFYYNLSKDDRNKIQSAIDEATTWGDKYVSDGANDTLERLKVEGGMTVVEPDLDAFRKAAAPAIKEVAKDFHSEVAKYVLSFIGK